MKKNGLFNWSGGKDSTLALHYVLEDKSFDIRYLLTTVNEVYNRVSMHGVREALLIEQAKSLDIPLYQIRLPESPDMKVYEAHMNKHLSLLKAEGITHSIFGDLFLEDLKTYREKKLGEIGIEAVFPIWKRDTTEVLKTFISLGYKTVVVCAKAGLEEFVGRIIDKSFIEDLPSDVDPCGENGEFHTFVFDGPIFKRPIDFALGEKVYKTYPSPNGQIDETAGYWYVDLI